MILWTAENSTRWFASLPSVLGGPTKNRRSYAVSTHYGKQSADVDLSAILSQTINKNTKMGAQFERSVCSGRNFFPTNIYYVLCTYSTVRFLRKLLDWSRFPKIEEPFFFFLLPSSLSSRVLPTCIDVHNNF